MKKRLQLLITMVATATMAMALLAVPATAAPGASTCVFEGTATLPTFPDANGTGGTFSGTATCAGTYTAVQVPMTATFDYTEDFCPVQGTASGTFSINNGEVTGDFDWIRAGVSAAITLSNVNGGGATNASGAGEAEFVAEANAATCPGTKVTAEVVGSASIGDTD